jgi:FHA domain-containing protein
MKEIVDRAKQLSRTMAGRLRRAVDPPLASDATPLEIRHFIIESIEARVQPSGGGRRTLPDTLVDVKIVAADPAAQRALRTALDDVQSGVLARLRELSCDLPAGFSVQVTYLKRAPSGWPADRRLAIEYPHVQAVEAAPSSGMPELTLTIARGSATQESYTFTLPIIRVGRSPAPQDDRGRTRRNDVAFLEDGNDDSMTVTRGHCEIRYSRAGGGYRVFDERSANGTRIVRNGEIIDVPANDPMGVAIVDGDELQFGTAAVRVVICDVRSAPL